MLPFNCVLILSGLKRIHRFWISCFLPTITSMRHSWLVLLGKMLPLSWLLLPKKKSCYVLYSKGWKESLAMIRPMCTLNFLPHVFQGQAGAAFHWLLLFRKTPNSCDRGPKQCSGTLIRGQILTPWKVNKTVSCWWAIMSRRQEGLLVRIFKAFYLMQVN